MRARWKRFGATIPNVPAAQGRPVLGRPPIGIYTVLCETLRAKYPSALGIEPNSLVEAKIGCIGPTLGGAPPKLGPTEPNIQSNLARLNPTRERSNTAGTRLSLTLSSAATNVRNIAKNLCPRRESSARSGKGEERRL